MPAIATSIELDAIDVDSSTPEPACQGNRVRGKTALERLAMTLCAGARRSRSGVAQETREQIR
ncbi:hypothetical protein [Acidiferrobacter sp.]|uniref:hypothetical protein n=1 Tax=Acidiferrobacter sp. TaxID=1872107 RepID=UPI00261A1142|nr:hypothetical protein [Acidiferrobacter sp.]